MSNEIPETENSPAPKSAPLPPGFYVPSHGGGDEISLVDCARVLIQYKGMVVGITLFVTVLAIVVALLSTPVYRAEVLMVSVSGEDVGGLSSLANQFGGLTSLVGIELGGDKSGPAEAIATLKSRAFTGQFIQEQNLLPIFFPDKWNSDTGKWDVADPEDIPTLRDAVRQFDKIREVEEDKTSGLVTLTIDWTDRELATLWANKLVDRVNLMLRERATAQAEKSLGYLTQELEKTNVVELQQAIYRLIETSINEIMLANVRDEYAFRVVDPAAVLEEEDRIWPNRKLIVAIGVLLGGFIGFFAAMVRNFLRSQVPKTE